MTSKGNPNRDNLGRFTSGSYKKELDQMKKDLKTYIVDPSEPANVSSGLNPEARRLIRSIDKKFLSKNYSSKRKTNFIKIKTTLKKYR